MPSLNSQAIAVIVVLSLLAIFYNRLSQIEEAIAVLSTENSQLKALLRDNNSPNLERLSLPKLFNQPSPPNLPQKDDPSKVVDGERGIYGGRGDVAHLGGFTANDTMGQSIALWTYMMKKLTVKSLIDVGCGRGISTKFFLDHGAKVLCVEGSRDALKQSVLPKNFIVEHDFYQGAWWPSETFDAMWAIEFLEHISREKIENYAPILQRSALVFATHSVWGGWHHVEVHRENWWWRIRLGSYGLVYSRELTMICRRVAMDFASANYSSQHLVHSLQVYYNPAVLSLPKHAHLIGGPDCYLDGKTVKWCDGADRLSERFLPVYKDPTPFDNHKAFTNIDNFLDLE